MNEPEGRRSGMKGRLGCALGMWLGLFSISTGIAGAGFALIVLPLMAGSWDHLEHQPPALTVWMIDNNIVIAVVAILACAGATVIGARMQPRRLWLPLYVLLALIPVTIAIMGIFAWWMVYAQMLRDAMEV